MKLKSYLTLLLSAAALAVTGCVATQDGHTMAGFPSHDTLVSKYERSPETIAAAARVVLERNGKLIMDNVVNNSFKARVNERTVFVRITRIDSKITEVDTQARTGAGSDIDLAAEIDKQIALQLTVTP